MNKSDLTPHDKTRRLMLERPFKKWPLTDPKILIATCMKNEGPFILEWIAWHKSIGVTDFVVYSNDCTDGTTEILDRLNYLGYILHLPNPAIAVRSPRLQPIALQYTHQLSAFRTADIFISIDVDEFINVRRGQGKLFDLFDMVGEFDVLSMAELNHGSNSRETFERGWVTELFPKHQTEQPGNWKSGRGVKSITRLSDHTLKVRNHRPDVTQNAIWLDGSGRVLEVLKEDPSRNGIDCRGSYDFVVLDHFPLRSLDSYLVKMDRGDVVVKDKMVSERYWRMRNQNAHLTSDLNLGILKARALYDRIFTTDDQLMHLQRRAEEAHKARIAELKDQEIFRSRKKWVLENEWSK